MRTHKYRAWDGEAMLYPTDKEYGECFYFEYAPDGFVLHMIYQGPDEAFDETVDNAIFLEFTGLTDKNGVEIYEGDIIRYLDACDMSTESGYDFDEYMNQGVIEWSDREARFTVTNMDSIDLQTLIEDISESETEVIGNIYENPDLLEDS